MTNDDFTIGVEEEYQIIEPETRELLSRANVILATAQDSVGDSVQFEHYLSQIEIGTAIARSVPEVRSELTRVRREVIAAADRNGASGALRARRGAHRSPHDGVGSRGGHGRVASRVRKVALKNYGEWDEVAALARRTVERGSAARRQREIFAQNQLLEDVVDFVIAETARG